MCALVHGERAHAKIAENEHAVALLERFPCRRGDVVVVLREHAERIERLPRASFLGLQSLVHDVGRALDRALSPVRLYVCSLGSATQRVNSFPHVHLHVIPLFDGGEADRPAEVLTWSNGVFVYDEAEEMELAAKLRQNLADLPKGH